MLIRKRPILLSIARTLTPTAAALGGAVASTRRNYAAQKTGLRSDSASARLPCPRGARRGGDGAGDEARGARAACAVHRAAPAAAALPAARRDGHVAHTGERAGRGAARHVHLHQL